MGIGVVAHLAPPKHEAVDREVWVGLQVQEAVWHGAAISLGGEIVIEDRFGRAVLLGTGVPEAPDQLLFLGVDAHDRRTGSLAPHTQADAGKVAAAQMLISEVLREGTRMLAIGRSNWGKDCLRPMHSEATILRRPS